MSKKVRLLAVLLLVATMLPISAVPSAAGPNPKIKPHEQPFGEGGALGIAAWSTFDNPNYYYAPITSAPSGVYYRQAGLSPDGTKIVAAKTWTEGSITRREVVLMNADGTGEVVISPGNSGEGDIYQYGNPFWSDDGTAVGYVEVHNSNPNKVVRYDLATNTRTYIYEPTAPDDVANPDFLGASKTAIVFWDYGAGGAVADLFIWDGTTRTNITNTPDYKEYEPVSNGDGTKIVYWSGETTTEPVDHTHTLTYSGGVWVKDLGFTPIPGSYWSYWTTPAATHIATTMITDYSGTIDLYLYDATGAFVADLTGPGYTGGAGQWNFFGCMPQGPNGEFVITSNAGRVDPGRDIVIAAPRASLYVDDAGSDSNPGTEAAPFATIQKGVDEAIAGGTVHVAAGTYVEQVVINKSLTLQGSGTPTVQAPASPAAYKFPESSAWWEPVVFAFGGTADAGGNISGTEVVSVTISGFVVDGNDRAPSSGKRSAGILLRNADATVTGNTVRRMYVDGAETFGIIAYGDCNPLTISSNNVSGYARGGITANGDIGPLPDPANVLIQGNTVTGPGLGVPVTWAPNGIQLGWGATGTIRGNTVTGNGWPGTEWTGSGIIVAGSDDVIVEQNTVTGNETAISVVGDNFFGSGETADRIIVRQNTIQGNTYGVSLQDRVVDAQVLANTITGQSYDGIDVCNFHSLPPTGTVIHNNKIYGNNTEKDATSGGLWVANGVVSVNAEENWWGDATGPSGVGPGEGDAIIAPAGVVDYEPWWADEGMTSRGWVVNSGETIQDVVDGANTGDTIVIPAGTYSGGVTLNKSIIIKGEPGTVIGPGSDGITVSANDVTIEDVTLDGTGGDPGDVGIRVNAGVQRLHIEGCEIRNWPDDGIHFNGAITGLKVVDNYIHNNGGDGMEFNATPAGTVQIYGNALRANTGYGVNAVSGSVVAEYNEWGDIAGPTGTNGDGVSGSVDYDPWVFGAVYADVVPDPARVREGENVDVDIKVDTANLYGAQFSLTFDPAKLQVVSTTDSGAGYFKGSQECSTTYNNTSGTLTFYCSRGGTDAAVSGSGVKLLTITFQAQEISGTSTTATIDLDTASVKLGAVGGVNIYVDSVTDDSLTIYGTTDVSGVVDLQGRANDSGAVVTFPAGVLYPGGTDTTDSWGRYDFAGVTDGSYLVTIEMARYLDASATVSVAGDTLTLNTVMLLGGDANDSDKIDISDLSIIGGQFGKSGSGITDPRADINNDNTVDILDIVLAAGNYDLTSSPWTP